MNPTRRFTGLLAAAFAAGLLVTSAHAAPADSSSKSRKPASIEFDMVHSAGVATCLPNAGGHVRISSDGIVQTMHIDVHGLPANTIFTVFILQAPTAPFGMSWYAGDVQTDKDGNGEQKLVGIFSDETFIHAPGAVPAPVVHPSDANTNPTTAPVHMYHVGMWFDDQKDAVANKCPTPTTPFNGDHTAGVQVLNTSNFPDIGPLHQLQ
jgi:hypothetical protein